MQYTHNPTRARPHTQRIITQRSLNLPHWIKLTTKGYLVPISRLNGNVGPKCKLPPKYILWFMDSCGIN